jgi:hypothetical protein
LEAAPPKKEADSIMAFWLVKLKLKQYNDLYNNKVQAQQLT